MTSGHELFRILIFATLPALISGCEKKPSKAPSEAVVARSKAPTTTGFLRSRKTQLVVSGGGIDYSQKIEAIAPEGATVRAGDLLVRLVGEHEEEWANNDANYQMQRKNSMEQELEKLRSDIRQREDAVAQREQEVRILELGGTDAGDYIPARIALLNRLDLENRRLRLRLAKEGLERKRQLLALNERAYASLLEVQKSTIAKWKSSKDAGLRTASMDGVVVYKRNPWQGSKPRVGALTSSGTEIMNVVDERALFVEAFVRETARGHFQVGQPVSVRLRGQRETTVTGRVSRMGTMVMRGSDWDKTLGANSPLFQVRVFRAEVELDAVPPDARPDGEVAIEAMGERS